MSTTESSRSTSVTTLSKAPVTTWALLGTVFVGLQLYLYSRWLLSGPSPTPRGDTKVPLWMDIAVWSHIALGIPIAIAMVYVVAVKPWRVGHHLTNDALFMFAIASMFWQDLLMNYLHYTVVYTTAWPNLGSWYEFVPGWQNPNGGLVASAAVFFWPMYIVVLYGFTSVAGRVLFAAHQRRPQTSKVGMFGIAFVLALAVNLTLEAGWARLGLYVFASTLKPLTLFAGHYYQYPLYHGVIWAIAWAGLTVLRYFKNDAGLTAAEHGIEKLVLSSPRRTVIRFLALAGATNLIFLAYNLSTGAIHAHSRAWIEEISTKSYYTNGLCLPEFARPETAYVCPQPQRGR
jgi:hypothetical protein